MSFIKSFIHYIKLKTSVLLACIVIVLMITMALFAYHIIPDKSHNANQMILELSAKPIGFKKKMLLVPKSNNIEQSSFFTQFWKGKASSYELVPVNGYWMDKESIYVAHYIDEGLTDTLIYPLSLWLHKEGTHGWEEKKFIQEQIFYLGTDRYGRDILSRLILGSRISLAVGIVSVGLSLLLGVLFGSLAGWYGGRVDQLVMWLMNVLWSIPTLLLVFALTISIGKGFWEIFIAIGLTSWVGAARLIRGQIMQIKNLDYITAAKVLGLNDFRIIVKHILPNIAGPVLVVAAATFASAILTEAGLSFLGIGVQPPTPSWGLMIKEHYNFLIAGNPWPALIPGMAIMILVFSFNIIGNALRDFIDVKQ